MRKRNFEIEYSDRIGDKFSFLADTVNDEEEFNEISELISTELAKLGDKCHKILRMFYFERQKMEDIALAMNFSNVDSAKTQKYKCFERLRSAIRARYPNVINR